MSTAPDLHMSRPALSILPSAVDVPAKPDVERTVLANLYVAPDRAAILAAELHVNLFNDLRHREIFLATRRIIESGRQPDPLLLHDELKRIGTKTAGDAAYWSSLPDEKVVRELFPEHVETLKRVASMRSALELSDRIRIAVVGGEDGDVLLESARSFFEGMDVSRNGSNPWTPLLSDGADIVKRELPPVVQIVEGIIGERAKLVIGSGSKSFKTWITIHLALCIAHGIKFLGRACNRSRVLYVNLELKAETFERRVQTIAKHQGIEIQPEWFVHLPLRGKLSRLSTQEIIDRIIALALHAKAGVVVIDPIYKLNQGEENSSRDQTILFNELDRLTVEASAAVILNDHFSKGNQSEKDPLDAIRGSSAKGGDVDAAMVLRKHELDDVFRVDMIHRELPPVAPFCIGWRFPCFIVRPDLDPEDMKKPGGGRQPEHSPAELLEFIRATTPETGISISAWAEAADVHRSTLSGYLPALRQQDLIRTAGAGSAARQYITEKGLASLK